MTSGRWWTPARRHGSWSSASPSWIGEAEGSIPPGGAKRVSARSGIGAGHRPCSPSPEFPRSVSFGVGEPNRFEICRLLARRHATVTEIMEQLALAQPLVSHTTSSAFGMRP
jgi:Bacterial regulatory protein, arsR family